MKKQYKLKDIGAFKGGVTSIKPTDYGYGTPFITYKNIFQNPKVDINMLTLMNVPKKDLQKCSCKYGDIFFTASSEVFEEVAMSSVLLDKGIKNLTFNGFSKRFRLFDFNTLLPEYAVYYFRSREFRNSIAAITTGDIRFNVSQENLSNITITLPPLSEQKRIANILSSFDNKIEILKKENKILEDIAENIFKEWFVKYNFPNKDGKPYRDNNGKMIDSELGSIPEGWRIGKLGDFGQVICGKTPSTKNSSFFGGNYPFIKIPDMTELYVFKTESTLTDLGSKELNGKMVPANSICVSCIATIGKVSITTEDSFTNQQINTIIPNKNIYREYLYFTLSNMQEYLELIGNRGSTTFNINTEMFRNLEIIIPNEELLESFSSATASLFEKILVNSKLTMNLEIQKDKLLKELVK